MRQYKHKTRDQNANLDQSQTTRVIPETRRAH